MDNNLILGRYCHTAFPGAVASYIRGLVEIGRRNSDGTPNYKRHIAALEALASYVGGLGDADQRMRALWLAQSSTATGAEYRPGPRQTRLLSVVGLDKTAPPDFGETLSELVAAAVEDVVDAHRAGADILARDASGARAREAKALVFQPRAIEAEEKVQRLKREVENLRGQLEVAGRDRDHFKAMTLGAEEPKAESRRTSVEGESHVFYRVNADGATVFEVSFTDEDGKRRWRTVGTDLEQALALRDELHAEPVQ